VEKAWQARGSPGESRVDHLGRGGGRRRSCVFQVPRGCPLKGALRGRGAPPSGGSDHSGDPLGSDAPIRLRLSWLVQGPAPGHAICLARHFTGKDQGRASSLPTNRPARQTKVAQSSPARRARRNGNLGESTKSQIPNKSQIQRSKEPPLLNLGALNLFGVWGFEFSRIPTEHRRTCPKNYAPSGGISFDSEPSLSSKDFCG
jgi:hypothetical protein